MSRLQQLQRMLADEPDDVFLNFSLAMELAKLGRSDEALGQFDRVIQLDPSNAAAYFQKANLLINLEQRDQAKAVLREGMAVAERAGDLHTRDRMAALLGAMS